MLYRAVGNLLHHLPAPERSHTVLKRLVTRGPGGNRGPAPRKIAPVRWPIVAPVAMAPTKMIPFIDVCQAHTLWMRHVGHWSRTTFDVQRLARRLGKKPWYRPLVSP